MQVLTGDSSCVSWEPSSQGVSVANAISTDRMGHEEIYIGRAPFSSSLTVGRIQPSHRCLYIPYNGKEHRIEHYEVLVYKPKTDMGAWRVGAGKNVKTNQPLIPSLVSNCKNLGSNATLHNATSRRCERRSPRRPQVDNLAMNIQSSLNISNAMACMCCGKAISRDKPVGDKFDWRIEQQVVFNCNFLGRVGQKQKLNLKMNSMDEILF